MATLSPFLAAAVGASWSGFQRPHYMRQPTLATSASGRGARPLLARCRSSYEASWHSFTRCNGLFPPRTPALYVANANAPNKDPAAGEVDSTAIGPADSPPLLTILAGMIVFLLIVWILGSIVMWLIGLIVNVPSS